MVLIMAFFVHATTTTTTTTPTTPKQIAPSEITFLVHSLRGVKEGKKGGRAR
jgi:hypothetical protein